MKEDRKTGARHLWLVPAILARWEAEIKKTEVPGQSGKKLTKSPSQPIAGCGGVYLLSKDMQEVEIRRIEILS
jgi:hypothetical protein